MDKKPSEYISEFLNFVTSAQSQYVFYLDEMHKQEDLTQDYLHSLELDGLNCAERSKIATKLVVNRKDRRYYKDLVEELQPVVEFFNDIERRDRKKVLNELTQLLGAVRKAEARHVGRKYIPKINKE